MLHTPNRGRFGWPSASILGAYKWRDGQFVSDGRAEDDDSQPIATLRLTSEAWMGGGARWTFLTHASKSPQYSAFASEPLEAYVRRGEPAPCPESVTSWKHWKTNRCATRAVRHARRSARPFPSSPAPPAAHAQLRAGALHDPLRAGGAKVRVLRAAAAADGAAGRRIRAAEREHPGPVHVGARRLRLRRLRRAGEPRARRRGVHGRDGVDVHHAPQPVPGVRAPAQGGVVPRECDAVEVLERQGGAARMRAARPARRAPPPAAEPT